MNQRGFATLEVILMVMVIGILASIAVPRFTNVTTAANTAKVQSDLSVLDTAAAIYIMENGTPTTNTTLSITTDLKDYLQDASSIKPPIGDVYVNDESSKDTITISKDDNYTVEKQSDGSFRGILKSKTAGSFKKKNS